MSVLLDTGVVVAHLNTKDPRHPAARAALDEVLAGRHGRAYASDYVLDEAMTLARKRTRSHATAVSVADFILGRRAFQPFFDLLMVTGPVFREALRVYETYADRELSFTDATTIALVRRRGIGQVLSFDAGFDGIVPRREPGR